MHGGRGVQGEQGKGCNEWTGEGSQGAVGVQGGQGSKVRRRELREREQGTGQVLGEKLCDRGEKTAMGKKARHGEMCLKSLAIRKQRQPLK